MGKGEASGARPAFEQGEAVQRDWKVQGSGNEATGKASREPHSTDAQGSPCPADDGDALTTLSQRGHYLIRSVRQRTATARNALVRKRGRRRAGRGPSKLKPRTRARHRTDVSRTRPSRNICRAEAGEQCLCSHRVAVVSELKTTCQLGFT